MIKNLTNIKSFDRYIESIGGTKDKIIAIWEQGSYTEGLNDEFSDRDFVVVWEKLVPSAAKRLKAARTLDFDIHEIKDVSIIDKSFDLFFNGEFLTNIMHLTKETAEKWKKELNNDKTSKDIETTLLDISSLAAAGIYFQKNDWVSKVKTETKLTLSKRNIIIDYYIKNLETDLRLLEISTKRNELLPFLKYLEKILRSLQIIYLLRNNKQIISPKKFEARFAKIENGEITKLIRKITVKTDMSSIFENIILLSRNFQIKKSEKMRA